MYHLDVQLVQLIFLFGIIFSIFVGKLEHILVLLNAIQVLHYGVDLLVFALFSSFLKDVFVLYVCFYEPFNSIHVHLGCFKRIRNDEIFQKSKGYLQITFCQQEIEPQSVAQVDHAAEIIWQTHVVVKLLVYHFCHLDVYALLFWCLIVESSAYLHPDFVQVELLENKLLSLILTQKRFMHL
jgi:hypothetical protein